MRGRGGWRMAAVLVVLQQSPADPSAVQLCQLAQDMKYVTVQQVTVTVSQCKPDRVFAQGFGAP